MVKGIVNGKCQFLTWQRHFILCGSEISQRQAEDISPEKNL